MGEILAQGNLEERDFHNRKTEYCLRSSHTSYKPCCFLLLNHCLIRKFQRSSMAHEKAPPFRLC